VSERGGVQRGCLGDGRKQSNEREERMRKRWEWRGGGGCGERWGEVGDRGGGKGRLK